MSFSKARGLVAVLLSLSAISIIIISTSTDVNARTYIKIHFRNVPLAETVLIELNTPDELYTWRTMVLPVFDFSGTIRATLPEGTPLNACVTNLNTGAGPNCGSASVLYGYADFYIPMPR